VYVFFSTLCLLLFNCNDSIEFPAFAIGKRQNEIQYDFLIKIFKAKLPKTIKRQQRILPRQKENNLRLQHPW
jgi:hypothetical protein